MTTHYKTRAFVFKKNDRNEADRIFSVFTDDFGRLDIFAKAIRKNASKLRSGIDTFFMSDIEFIQGKSRKTLTDASIIKKFGNISKDPKKFKIASKISEILDSFIRGEEKDKEIFDLIEDTFCKLSDSTPKNNKDVLLYYYFLWNALSILGYRPEVEKCNACQQKLDPQNIYFSDKSAGTICKNCFKPGSEQKINSDVVKILRLIFKKDWQILSKLKIEPASQKLLVDISGKAIHDFYPS